METILDGPHAYWKLQLVTSSSCQNTRTRQKPRCKSEASYEFEKVKPLKTFADRNENKTRTATSSDTVKQVYFSSTLNSLFSQDALNYSLHKTFSFLILRGKKDNFVLLTCCPLQLCCVSQEVSRGNRHFTIQSQTPVLATTKFFFFLCFKKNHLKQNLRSSNIYRKSFKPTFS